MKHTLFEMVLAIGLCSLTSCSGERLVDASEKTPTRIESAPDASILEVQHPEQYTLVTVAARRSADEVPANGTVAPDVSRTVPVNSLTGGRVIEIHARLGDEVKKGQLLLKMVSQDLSSAIADYRKFQADELIARRQLDRAKLLFARGAIAEKDLQIADDVDVRAKFDIETAGQKITLLGGDLKTMSHVIEITAPSTGVIVEQNVTGGAGVKSLDNSPNLFTIADLSRVWVLCDVYENNLAQVRMGDFAEFRLNAYPDRLLRGRVSNISRILDPATRTAKVRLELDNAAGLLRPGMFAVVTFRSQLSRERSIAPSSAFLRLHDRDWVFVPSDTKHFRRIEVQAGAQVGDGMQEVLSGLKPGDRIVAQALQMSSAGEN